MSDLKDRLRQAQEKIAENNRKRAQLAGRLEQLNETLCGLHEKSLEEFGVPIEELEEAYEKLHKEAELLLRQAEVVLETAEKESK